MAESGEPIFEVATVDATLDYLANELGFSADEIESFVGLRAEEARARHEELSNNPPKMMSNPIEYRQAKADWQLAVSVAEGAMNYWGDVMTAIQASKAEQSVADSTEAEFVETSEPTSEPQPIGRGLFGNIYDQFRGKVKEAVSFLLGRKEGEAVGALHHNEIGDISLVYGADGYGLLHIANKHPEILDDLQGVISGMSIVSQSDNRIVLESPTHRAVVSKMLGDEVTDNWLLTAYEKKSPVSASSSDIETEPIGMQNGTAPLQNETSESEVSENNSDVQEEAQRIVTDAVIASLANSGIEVVEATDAMAEAVLGMATGGVELSAKKRRALETASVQEEHQPTVVSSAVGTKVLNNLDTVASEYEEKSNQPKTFLGDVAKAIGAERKGSGSQYVTFETKNGKVVTIRLSNHNAKVSNFDNNGEFDGISIVVSAKGNNGITNDGNAHIVEHYYDAIKLRRAEGKPLAEIVRSIKQALYSGEFTDTTGLAERQEVNLNEIEPLRTTQGVVYGWTDGKKVYLTKEGMNPETPIHEYTHIWAKAMMRNNPEGWKSIKDLLRGTPIWVEVLYDPNYADIRENEDALVSEALARMSGKENARRMEQEARKMIDEAKDAMEVATAVSLIERMKRALREFWSWVGKNLFDIKSFGRVEEVTDRVLWDLVSGTDLGRLEAGTVERMGSRVEKRMAEIASLFEGRELNEEQRAVADVFGGKADNLTISVKTHDGNTHNVVMRQGNENKAGVRHSVFRHYGTASNSYTADEILLIPQVIEQGERKQDGKKVSYKLEIDGVTYCVTTEMRRGAEEFTNFYTNKKPTRKSLLNTDEQHGTTSVSVSTDKGSEEVGDVQTSDGLSDELARPGDVFYSNAERAVLNIKQEKATPQQWLAMIEKQGGLKAGEDKWLGLSDWLKASDAKTLTKDEVLEFINQNKIVIEEVNYGTDETLSSIQSEFDELTETLGGYKEAFDEMVNRYGDDFRTAIWHDEVGTLHFEEGYEDYGESIGDFRGVNETRMSYTTEGLDNNREIALVVPTIDPYNSHDEIHFGDAGGGRAVAWVRFGETTIYDEIADYQEATEFHEPYKGASGHDIYKPIGSFRGGDYIVHGEARNGGMIYVVYINGKQIPVAHDSFEEAQNAMNEYYKEHPRILRKPVRVLVIDEIQSKRHQDGREKGYQQGREELVQKIKDLTLQRDNIVREILHKQGFIHYDEPSSMGRFNPDALDSAEAGRLGSKAEMDEIKRLNEEIRLLNLEDNKLVRKVPDAPFEKNWHELAMKRMLRYAAENGYDKVAWTTGEQQAERYKLSEQVGGIEVKLINGKYRVFTYNPQGRLITQATGEMTPEQVTETFGKDLGNRILAVEEGKKETITEEGLSFGGEGMKGFYDKMLPSFMNKYGKKWGVKVGEVSLIGETMHSVDVTDAMRESVMAGQAMFRPGEWMLDSKREVEIVETEPHEFKDFGEAREWAKREIVGEYINGEIGVVNVSNSAIGKYLSQKAVEQSDSRDVHLSALQVLPKIIETSAVGEVHADRDGNANIKDVVRLFGAVKIGDKTYRVKTTVKRYVDDNVKTKAYSYEVTEIELLDGTLKTHTQGADSFTTSNNSITLANLLKGVEKSNKPGEFLLDNAVVAGNNFAEVAERAGERLGVKVVVDPTLGSKGSYNLSTGEVRVNPDAHLTEADVERTVVHEVIGHGGMQALLGERFDGVCKMVFEQMSDEQVADIRRRHGKGLSDAEVGAEYMAETAERMASGEQPTSKLRQLWERIKGWIREALRRRGVAVAMTDADIRYMIATASRKAKSGRLQEMIDHATETRRLRRIAQMQDAVEGQLSQPLMRPKEGADSPLVKGIAGMTDAELVQRLELDGISKVIASRWNRENTTGSAAGFRTNMVDASHPIHKVLQKMYGLDTATS